MNLETKIIIYKFTPQVFTLTPKGISMSDRSLKGFLNNFKNDEDEPCFRPTLRLTVGFRYTLK